MTRQLGNWQGHEAATTPGRRDERRSRVPHGSWWTRLQRAGATGNHGTAGGEKKHPLLPAPRPPVPARASSAVLIHAGVQHAKARAGGHTQQTLISDGSGGWKARTSRGGLLPAPSTLSSLGPHEAERATEPSGLSFRRALIPSRGLHPCDLITKAPPPRAITLGFRFRHVQFGGDKNTS